MGWFKRTAQRQNPGQASGDARPELISDLKLERLRRAVRDFPGRVEADLARIIYGRADPELVATDSQRLEADGLVTRHPETGRLYTTGR